MPEQDPQSRIGAFVNGGREALRGGIDTLRQNTGRLMAVGEIAAIGVGASLGLVAPEAASAEPAHTQPVAEASANEGMQPNGIMKGISRAYIGKHPGSAYMFRLPAMNYVKGSLSDGRILISGQCNPKNPYRPASKSVLDTTNVTVSTVCIKRNGHYVTGKTNHDPVSYSTPLQKLGSRAASSVGFKPTTHGPASNIVATKKRATIRFAQDPSVTDGLKSLVIRRGKAPIKNFY